MKEVVSKSRYWKRPLFQEAQQGKAQGPVSMAALGQRGRPKEGPAECAAWEAREPDL